MAFGRSCRSSSSTKQRSFPRQSYGLVGSVLEVGGCKEITVFALHGTDQFSTRNKKKIVKEDVKSDWIDITELRNHELMSQHRNGI